MRLLSWTVLLAIAISAGRADADPKRDAKPHVLEADRDYKVGRFSEALAEYTSAYDIYPTPPLLFNIAQCHRGLKNWERAIFFFDGYLAARPAAENRKVVEELIAEAQGELDKLHEAELAAKRRAEADEAIRQRAVKLRLDEEQHLHLEAERQQLADARGVAPHAREHDDRWTRQWWFWSAVGTVALAAGGTAYYFSGSTTTVPPTGSLGGLDRR